MKKKRLHHIPYIVILHGVADVLVIKPPVYQWKCGCNLQSSESTIQSEHAVLTLDTVEANS